MEKISLREFKPDGVTIPEDAKDSDDVVKRGLFYRFYVTGPQGAHFELWREKHHTDDDVGLAKRWIRQNHDVVHIAVLHDDGIEEMSLGTYLKQKDPKGASEIRVILKDDEYRRSISWKEDGEIVTGIIIKHYPQFKYKLYNGSGYLLSENENRSVFYIPKLKMREQDVRKLDNTNK